MKSINEEIKKLSPVEIERLAKEGERHYSRKYREKNKEAIELSRNRFFAKKALQGTGRQVSDLTEEEIVELARPEKLKYSREYRQKNKAKIKDYYREYRQEHKEKIKESRLRSLAKLALEIQKVESGEEDVQIHVNDHPQPTLNECDISVFVSNTLEENEKTDRYTIEVEITTDFEKGTSTSEIENFIINKLISGT